MVMTMVVVIGCSEGHSDGKGGVSVGRKGDDSVSGKDVMIEVMVGGCLVYLGMVVVVVVVRGSDGHCGDYENGGREASYDSIGGRNAGDSGGPK